jgi:hypothetical protein
MGCLPRTPTQTKPEQETDGVAMVIMNEGTIYYHHRFLLNTQPGNSMPNQ